LKYINYDDERSLINEKFFLKLSKHTTFSMDYFIKARLASYQFLPVTKRCIYLDVSTMVVFSTK